MGPGCDAVLARGPPRGSAGGKQRGVPGLWRTPWAPGGGAGRPGSLRSAAEPGDVPAPGGIILELARSGGRRTSGTALSRLRGGRPAVLYRQVSACFLLAAFPSSPVTFFIIYLFIWRLLVACPRLGPSCDGRRRQQQFPGVLGCGDCRGAQIQLRESARASPSCRAPRPSASRFCNYKR